MSTPQESVANVETDKRQRSKAKSDIARPRSVKPTGKAVEYKTSQLLAARSDRASPSINKNTKPYKNIIRRPQKREGGRITTGTMEKSV